MERGKRLVGDRWKLSVVENVVKGGGGGGGGGGRRNEEKVKNCFLVKQGQRRDFPSRV